MIDRDECLGFMNVKMKKGFNLIHGYVYRVQIFSKQHGYNLGYGFSKNKFTAVRKAIKDLRKPQI